MFYSTQAVAQNNTYDAVIILGGGLNEHGQPHDWVKARLDLSVTYNSEYYIVRYVFCQS